MRSVEPPQMRDRILDEAVRLFSRAGYEGTSLQDVADAVGIRKPSLLYHFDSKQALHEAVVEALLVHWKNEVPALLAAAEGEDRFSAAITAFVAYLRADPNRARLALREVLDHPEGTRARIRKHLGAWMPLLTDYIRLGQQAGRVRPDVHPEAYVVEVAIMIVGTVAIGDIASAMVEEPSPTALDAKLVELVRIARAGLFVAPDRTARSTPST